MVESFFCLTVTDVVRGICHAKREDPAFFQRFLGIGEKFTRKKSVDLEGVRVGQVNDDRVIFCCCSLDVPSPVGVYDGKGRNLFYETEVTGPHP